MCGQRNEFHYVGLSDRRPCVLLLLRWHYMKFLALLSCQCCLFPLLPPTPLSLSHFSRLRKQPPNSPAKFWRMRYEGEGCSSAWQTVCDSSLGSAAWQLGSSLARLTASSNPNECSSLSVLCETRAFCLGPYLDWPSILCKNISSIKGCPWQRNCVNNT